ncbi:MCE family protein [Mycobacterium sp. GA-1841]|uniref:MCE family protein n=1 Tax=Mycobacterium sp. GA-1841 TaxID=1834154 RepID=UPI0020C9427C|nr:MCE family protein [Mycobacterium sp. GA-1841]
MSRLHPPQYKRPLAGFATVAALIGVLALAVSLFRGDFRQGMPVTVLSHRAGLVLNAGAKVKLHGVQIGRVTAIETRPDGQAAIHLALDESHVHLVPANVLVEIASPTAFGAKAVELRDPEHPVSQRISAGQVIGARHVMVEINTLFEQLTTLLDHVPPDKLNETLSTLGSALSGRGHRIGQTIDDFDAFLAATEPALPALSHDLAVAPTVFGTYVDAAPEFLTTIDNVTRISNSIIDERHHLDAFLLSTIGLAQSGTSMLSENRQSLADALHLLVPTTHLTNEYNAALHCQLTAMAYMSKWQPLRIPGAEVIAGLTAGQERYRYPGDLPKVAAKGGPHCEDLPVPFLGRPRWVVADTGSNPWKYGNQNILLNTDGLKQWLFGPLDGPPRNTAQIGQPG